MPATRLKVGLDTSVLVALLLEEHGHHEMTRREWDRLCRQNVLFVVACHALLECFSVVTRIPAPFRRPPNVAAQLLRETLSQDTEIPGVDAASAWSAIEEIAGIGMGGATLYDAVIARSAFTSGGAVLLTWNIRDFVRVAPPGLEIATPAEWGARASRVH